MTAFLYGVIYAAVAVFIAGCVIRALRYARAPIHLRWELYPVPHEEPHRAAHGGSYFEETDWWTRPARRNYWGELKAMLPEMLFLKGLYEFNRKLWRRSFPFHFGLYLLIATAALVLLAAALAIAAPNVMAGPLALGLHYFYTGTGWLGSALALLGAAALLHRRLTDSELRIYTTPGDILNLAMFIAAIGLLAVGYLTRGPDAASTRDFIRGLLLFDANLRVSPIAAAGVLVSALLVAYIPFTHMSHFIAKYFTYHSVRWEDTPLARRRQIERKIAECLAYRPSWSASHVGAGGKTWAEIAAANPWAKVKK